MNKFLLLLLPVLLCYAGCLDDDDSPDFCEFDDLNDCTPLQTLNEQEHFAAVLGSWTVVHSVNPWMPTDECPAPPEDTRAIVFNADSTFMVSVGDLVNEGRWEIEQVSMSPTENLTRLVITEGTNTSLIIRNVCDGNIAFTNDTPLDGPLNVFSRN